MVEWGRQTRQSGASTGRMMSTAATLRCPLQPLLRERLGTRKSSSSRSARRCRSTGSKVRRMRQPAQRTFRERRRRNRTSPAPPKAAATAQPLTTALLTVPALFLTQLTRGLEGSGEDGKWLALSPRLRESTKPCKVLCPRFLPCRKAGRPTEHARPCCLTSMLTAVRVAIPGSLDGRRHRRNWGKLHGLMS